MIDTLSPASTSSIPSQAHIDSAVARLRAEFGGHVQTATSLQKYTAARIGGPADILLTVSTADQLADAVSILQEEQVPFWLLGGGSNVLISDKGVRAAVILNRARKIRFKQTGSRPLIWAESGASLGSIARQAAARGLSGLEWAAGIPGTIGGAVVGNAGAHDGDMAGNLLLAEILHLSGQREVWNVSRFQYGYRTSFLKQIQGQAVVLSATLEVKPKPVEEIQEKMDRFLEQRRRTQPPGASMGSMFKNPSGDYAGRLIDAAGLKGLVVGGAAISELHANFFINQGEASASDVYQLIRIARETVYKKFGITLELEIELLGEWQE